MAVARQATAEARLQAVEATAEAVQEDTEDKDTHLI